MMTAAAIVEGIDTIDAQPEPQLLQFERGA